MKVIRLLVAISLFWLGASCSGDEGEFTLHELAVNAYTQVLVKGKIKVQFYIENTSGYTVIINASENFQPMITVESVGGVLIITASEDIVLSDDIIVEVYAPFVEEIRLERNQVAEFIGVFDQERLRVVTEANSELSLLGLRVDRLEAKLEGESVLNLSTWYAPYDGDLFFPEKAGILIGDNILLVDNTRLIIAEEIVLSDIAPYEWLIHGDNVQEYFLMESADYKTEGNTLLNAEEAPAENIFIKLEGSSQASVWALDRISGKGEGSSELYYRGFPDLSGFITEGNAQIFSIN